jgi:hypothetical protein
MTFTPEIAAVQVQNAHRSLELVNRALVVWAIAYVGVISIPNTGSFGLRLTTFDAQLPSTLVGLFLASLVFACGLVANLALTNVKEIVSKVPNEEQRRAVLTYPSLVTLGGPTLRTSVIGYVALLQVCLGAFAFIGRDGAVTKLSLAIGLLYSLPMAALTFRISRWPS